jgi:hypothetical protein|tara:strand:+ start:22 stop:378 length:357 start_codon:yes stop_codon:yes gene_type:complete
MASLRAKIIEYCKDNSVTDVDFTKDVLMQNNSDGNGDFIAQWNIDGLAQPNDSTLNSFDTKGNTLESLETVQSNRGMSYPAIKEQLDLLYKDMLADKGDKTGDWFAAVKKVKDDNPKG